MSVLAPTAPGVTTDVVEASDSFLVQLEEFSGPFDVLLSLIAKHRLDVTALSLHQVTDDFLAYIKELGEKWTLDEATQFLVIAATLLDLKAARLLPGGEVEDEEDLAVLEARDLLVARLLQYRAFKKMSADFKYRLATAGRMHPRTVGIDPRFQGLLPEVVFNFGPDDFANLASRALEPKLPEVISVAHIHAARVSVREQAAIIVERLRRMGTATFKTLTRDCDTTLLVVARFLALLEIYRDGVVLFDQPTPLGDLHIRWVGDDKVDLNREIDEFDTTVVDEDFELAPPADAESDVHVEGIADQLEDDDLGKDDEDFDVNTDQEETPSNEGENVTDE